MSERNWKLFVEDMLETIDNILEYTSGLSKDEFLAAKMTKDAVVRNLEVLGEAANQIPANIYSKYPDIKLERHRWITQHHYSSILWRRL